MIGDTGHGIRDTAGSASHELLRFSTAGSVDDGKSTLIGRLLYDSKSIFEDQLAAITLSTQRRGREGVDLALLTDGLSAEREQGITIDVAYRYFATPKRKFIIADTPGHEQYTRNMVTGASTADAALILVDARKGLLPQSRRHAAISHLLGIPHILVCVNKMDLVDHDQAVFERIRAEFSDFADKLGAKDLRFIPLSALNGDNVVAKSENMPWYEGKALLEILETLEVFSHAIASELRFPVQYVNRPHADFRGYAGLICGGTVKPGQEVRVLPAGKTTRVKAVHTFDGHKDVAFHPMSVTLLLEDEIDVSRGDMIVDASAAPRITNAFSAKLCWMAEDALLARSRFVIKHASKSVKAVVTNLVHRVDVGTLATEAADELKLNDIGLVEIKTTSSLVIDSYEKNRLTGSFVLIDETTNNTVAAGMIV